MNKKDLEKLIVLEIQKSVKLNIQKVVRDELQKVVKNLVQEAVAGAMAGLLAEGIVNGSPGKSIVRGPNIPQAKPVNAPNRPPEGSNDAYNPGVRSRLAQKYGMNVNEIVSSNRTPFQPTGNLLDDILTETSMQMHGHIDDPSTPSVLDNIDELGQFISPDAVAAITKDYTKLVERMDRGR